MERIPDILCRTIVTVKNNKPVTTEEALDLKTHDLPMEASFTCTPYTGTQFNLIPFKYKMSKEDNMPERIPDTGLHIKFKGGFFTVHNLNLLNIILQSKAFRDNKIQINPEDPKGFWRAAGFIKTVAVPVIDKITVSKPTTEDIDLKKVAAVAKDEAEKSPEEKMLPISGFAHSR